MRTYVINLDPERKVTLEQHLAAFGIDDVTWLPGVEPVDESDEAKKVAIHEAHRQAIKVVEVPALLMQDDVRFDRHPHRVPEYPSVVTVLSGFIRPSHVCPQAVLVRTEEVRAQLEAAWKRDELLCEWVDAVKWHSIPLGNTDG